MEGFGTTTCKIPYDMQMTCKLKLLILNQGQDCVRISTKVKSTPRGERVAAHQRSTRDSMPNTPTAGEWTKKRSMPAISSPTPSPQLKRAPTRHRTDRCDGIAIEIRPG